MNLDTYIKQLIEKHRLVLAESNLHWPEYLPGDPAIEYLKEEYATATASAISEVEGIIEAMEDQLNYFEKYKLLTITAYAKDKINFYKQALEKMAGNKQLIQK